MSRFLVNNFCNCSNFEQNPSSYFVSIFFFFQYVRLFRIGPFGSTVHSALVVFLDDKDSGDLILTHVYLLLGLALPLWLFPVDYSKADPTGEFKTQEDCEKH